jgi:hypothetical protein
VKVGPGVAFIVGVLAGSPFPIRRFVAAFHFLREIVRGEVPRSPGAGLGELGGKPIPLKPPDGEKLSKSEPIRPPRVPPSAGDTSRVGDGCLVSAPDPGAMALDRGCGGPPCGWSLGPSRRGSLTNDADAAASPDPADRSCRRGQPRHSSLQPRRTSAADPPLGEPLRLCARRLPAKGAAIATGVMRWR